MNILLMGKQVLTAFSFEVVKEVDLLYIYRSVLIVFNDDSDCA